MTYDTDNRLTRVVKGSTTVNYQYDWSNRLIKKPVNGVTTRFIYDGWPVIAEANGSEAIVKKYVNGPWVDEVLTQKNGSTIRYLLQDGLGSTSEILSSSAAIQQRYVYDAFGAVTVQNASGGTITTLPLTNYLFTGRELQPESSSLSGGARRGLYNYRNRFYHSGIGRFLQPDPIGFWGGDVNLYTYVGNDPINWTDPDGLYTWGEWGDIGMGGLGGLNQGTRGTLNSFSGGFFDQRYGAFYEPGDECNEGFQQGAWGARAGITTLAAAGGLHAAGIRGTFGLHGPHHTFGSLGRLNHLQANFWRQGVKGSGRAFRIPLPTKTSSTCPP